MVLQSCKHHHYYIQRYSQNRGFEGTNCHASGLHSLFQLDIDLLINLIKKTFAKFVNTINEFLIDKFSPEQEIWLVITEPMESVKLWIESRVTQRRMDITVWEGITNNFKIEVIHFMVNNSIKFIVYNSNIEIWKVVTLITASTAFQYQSIIIIIFWDGARIFQIYCACIFSRYRQIYDNIFSKVIQSHSNMQTMFGINWQCNERWCISTYRYVKYLFKNSTVKLYIRIEKNNIPCFK